MTLSGNTLEDFPAEAFTVLVFCDACGHRSPLDRTKVPDGVTVQDLVRLLRCNACGSRAASIRIVYTGAGGFEYGGRTPPGSTGLAPNRQEPGPHPPEIPYPSGLLRRLARYDALLIDELGYLTWKPEQVNAFFKLMDLRYGRRASIITTNLDYPHWYELFQRKPLVDALLDRLQHHCITIRIDGPSLRVPDNDLDPVAPKRRRKASNNKK